MCFCTAKVGPNRAGRAFALAGTNAGRIDADAEIEGQLEAYLAGEGSE